MDQRHCRTAYVNFIGAAADNNSGPVYAAIITASASLVVALAALYQNWTARRAVDKQRSQDYRIRQLSELYGPLYMLSVTGARLWSQLAEPRGSLQKWRLIDHIEEIKNEPDERRRGIIARILEINSQRVHLIVGKAGLLKDLPPPESFSQFLEHASTLAAQWQRGMNATSADYIPFPREFDTDLKAALDDLRKGL